MYQLTDREIHERLQVIMARRKATKALKFITTNRIATAMEYELEGEL